MSISGSLRDVEAFAVSWRLEVFQQPTPRGDGGSRQELRVTGIPTLSVSPAGCVGTESNRHQP